MNSLQLSLYVALRSPRAWPLVGHRYWKPLSLAPCTGRAHSFSISSTDLRAQRWSREGIDYAAGQRQSTPRVALSAAGITLQQELARTKADPVAMLRDRMDADTANIETARVCMAAYYDHLWTMSRRRRRPHIIEGNVGKLTLECLWSKDHRWSEAVVTDTDFLEKLCYFATAADLDPQLIKWAAQPFPSSDHRSPRANRWRGSVVRGVMNGHLTLDCAASATGALEVFLGLADRVHDARHTDNEGPLASISLWPAQVDLCKKMQSGFYPMTDAHLWERFIDHCRMEHRTDGLAIVALCLTHPSNPDAGPALEYIQDQVEHLSLTEFSQLCPSGSAINKLMFFTLRRTELLLLKQNQVKTAEDIGALIRKLFDEQTQRTLGKQLERERTVIDDLRRGGGNFASSRQRSGIDTRPDKKHSEKL
ncbi:hypothetical protein LTS10_007583 [Elasticomyces elasticus]|nr:hypothetical protein LTS10_007583 [Elasticomyces elasticus]